MTLPYLPDDCIYHILKYLQPCHSTLFNCLLVNRFWCEATVPLLYANPFLYNSSRTSASNKKFSIILTLILCLNKTEILQLKNQLRLNNINNININYDHKPLFEYPKYLENFSYFIINSFFFSWTGLSNESKFNQHYRESENVIPILHQSILRQCNNIKQLNIPLHVLYDCNVQTINTITSNLAKLNSLTLHYFNESDNKISTKFLNNIENICLNLGKFEILSHSSFTMYNDYSINASDFCTIIQKQNNLEVIKLSSYCQSFLNDIFSSLEFQKHSLVDIEFHYIDFGNNISLKNFINLCNLKYLKFNSCNRGGTMDISLDEYEILKYASFKLKRLEFITSGSLFTSLMIKYLGASLQELILMDKPDIPITENISAYCLNLITLEVLIKNVDLLMLSRFMDLNTIRVLNINNIDPNWDDIYMNIMTIKYLANNYSRFANLKRIFENSHNFLEVIGINGPIKLRLLEVILDYIERSDGNLKYLGTTELEKELGEEELKLLNQIKSKGVKIVDFYSIYNKPVGNS